jgi:signal transduction histidine kinase/PAS domain-containing protein
MHAGGGTDGSRLDHRLRLVIVASPDAAAPLIGALDVADVGAWMWVEAERALYFSPRMLGLLGLTADPAGDFLRRFVNGVHPDDQAPVRDLVNRRLAAGAFRIRYRFTPRDGPLRWIEDSGRVERGPDGALVRQGGALRDVTGDVGRELERREADARLEALVNALPFAVWGRGGPDLAVTHQNAASIAMWGDMRGRPLDGAPAAVRHVWEQQLADAMTGQIVRARREADIAGQVRTIDEIIAPVIVDTAVTGVVGVTIDVSDEARASRFQALLIELSSDFAGRSTDTLDTGLIGALGKIARFVGAPLAVLCQLGSGQQQDLLRITHWWIDPATGQTEPRFVEIDTTQMRALLQRVELNSPVVVRSRDDLPADSGERAWLQAAGVRSFAVVPTRQLDGTRTLLALGGVQDGIVEWPADTVACLRIASTLLGGVLARARADADQKAVERRIQDAQRLESLGVLAGGIAHDFNNLLTAILGNASLLRVDLRHAPEAAEPLREIEAASRRAAELCRQMLAYAGRGRFALQSVDLSQIVRGMEALLQVTVAEPARLTIELDPSLPPVLGDAAQLQQLVMNLVLNAAESLGGGAGVVSLRTSSRTVTAAELAATVFGPERPGGTYVSLRVDDTGVGMTPGTMARIFEPFFSTKFTGRGLGLAATIGIVRAHLGALRVASTPGHGSTFELLLPEIHGSRAS